MVRVVIDREECISCKNCWTICPDVFEEDPDDTKSRIVEEYRNAGDPATGDVPSDLEACAIDAAAECPVEVIDVEE
ncbi:MAG: ferredoxin [Methanomicrobiaceae archaeon]|nr:ferredoxin [Methanomicrobiaceae archaeon]MDD5419074.1 ferredoxin [Methanomicrobiaceae archaeon]